MKLLTTIIPYSDGTLKLEGLDGVVYDFVPHEASGLRVADVDDSGGAVAHWLKTGYFQPLDEADYAEAETLLVGDDADNDEDSDFDDDMHADAPPMEANTPPIAKRKPGRPRKGT